MHGRWATGRTRSTFSGYGQHGAGDFGDDGRHGATDRQVAVRAMQTGAWAGPSFLLLDAYMCFVAYPGAPFGLVVIYRAVVEAAILVGLRASLREDADVPRLLRWQGLIFCFTTLTIALMVSEPPMARVHHVRGWDAPRL